MRCFFVLDRFSLDVRYFGRFLSWSDETAIEMYHCRYGPISQFYVLQCSKHLTLVVIVSIPL